MAKRQSISVRRTLRRLFPVTFLRGLARETGAVKRQRQVTAEALFWTLVLGFGVGRERTIAGLRRVYQKMSGQEIEESSFYDRFSEGLAEMLKRAVVQGLDGCLGVGRRLRGHLAQFRDVILTDSTVVRLHELLADVYPACRTNHTKAALKAHAVMSVRGVGRQSVRITSERVHDGPVFKVGPWAKGHLLLFDLGFFHYWLFARITEQEGYFISRLKVSANPKVVAMNRQHRGRAIAVVGEQLQDVIGRVQREVIDVMAEFPFKRRVYGGVRRGATQLLRVVGIRDEHTGKHHLYVTNVPVDKLAAEDVRCTYALRWQIELLFKELKSNYRMEDLPSRKKDVVESLLYAAILTLVVSRNLLNYVRRKLGELAERVPTQRWAAVLESLAHEILLLVLGPPRQLAWIDQRVSTTLLHEVVDPNAHRPGLLAQVEQGTHRYARQMRANH